MLQDSALSKFVIDIDTDKQRPVFVEKYYDYNSMSIYYNID